MIKIEKGRKIPKPKKGPGSNIIPWEKLKVGDSFFVKKHVSPGPDFREKYPKIKFTQRAVKGGVRVWRVA